MYAPLLATTACPDRAWLDWLRNRITVGRRGSRSPLELTDRDRDVAVLVAKGMTNRAVAAGLYASSKAVDYHLGHISGSWDHLRAGPAPAGAQLGVVPRDCRLGPEHAQSMQILIDIARSSDGRLTGTARPADSAGEGRRFAGVMELVACLEQLCATASHPSKPSGPDRGSYPQAPPAPTASQQPSTEGNHHG